MGHKFIYFAEKLAYFHKIFDQIKDLDIPLFVKFLNFDANKGKIPLFVFPYFD